ncbi:hypothetical protein QBC35DRAFT_151503 [Podospora australis]|uniref:Aminoglycoside phosphotransferase domain-containing protein n=1 Tax=Podospora australis TaxID=1536484 RepID=A0AAN6WIU5_9PEZI|nr:hypothetical protein QBC35DRAFT_151503 [Podospora australis]
MLVNPAHYSSSQGPFHQPSPPPPQAVEVDPFQSLYDSLANLTLTATASPLLLPHSSTTTPSNHNASAAAEEEAIIPDAAPIVSLPLSSRNDDTTPPPIPVNIIFPPGDNVVFAHSSYYRQFREQLPSVLHVRTQAILSAGRLPLPSPSYLIPFPGQGLLAHYGPDSNVTATEGKNLLLLRQIFKNGEIPVPEVYGWRRDAENGERVVYTSLPQGNTLEDRWGGLTDVEKTSVCEELRGIVRTWRRLEQGDKHRGREIVGSIDNTPLNDQIFRLLPNTSNSKMTLPPPGPFPNVSNFHSYFVATAVAISQSRHARAGNQAGEVNYQPHHLLPDNVPITFTHGALHPRNVIISEGPNPRVVSIIGWEQAGWYPAYWELCKARWECSQRKGLASDWETRYLPAILNLDGFGLEMQGWNGRALCQYWDYFVGLMHQWE